MIYPCKTNVPNFSMLAYAALILALIGVIVPLEAQQSNETALPPGPGISYGGSGEWQSGELVHLIGLPRIEEREKGSLSISPAALTFVSPKERASVQRTDVLSVSIGDVSVESGGTAGKITRAIIPFGGGSALATVTHKQLGLLTIEFRDQNDALHGAVFLLPKDEALEAQERLGEQTWPHSTEPPHEQCKANDDHLPNTIKVTAITATGDPVPAEYRMLIYEQLVRRLGELSRFNAVYRDGDDEPKAECPTYNLVLTLDAFKKGNAAVRASTGPVGFFVGATKLKFHFQVEDVRGKTVLDKELQCSKRGDTDSLDIADKIAKSLTKHLKKAAIPTTKA